jgi:hypothetical protein
VEEQKAPPPVQEPRDRLRAAAAATGVLAASLLVVLVTLAAVFGWLAARNIFYPDFALPMLLLAGAVLFIGAITVLVNVYQRLNLDDKAQALGLPEGSVRAIIALILIFLFFVAVTFIYASLSRGGPPRNLGGITPAQFAQIPVNDILSSTPQPSTGTPTSYDVVLRGSVAGAAEDVAKNLVVLLGTLVTAVAAFYFGTNSVTSAAKATAEAIRGSGGSPEGEKQPPEGEKQPPEGEKQPPEGER